jgi:hypothetical protein
MDPQTSTSLSSPTADSKMEKNNNEQEQISQNDMLAMSESKWIEELAAMAQGESHCVDDKTKGNGGESLPGKTHVKAMIHPEASARVCKALWKSTNDEDWQMVDKIRQNMLASADPFRVLYETEDLNHVELCLNQNHIAWFLAKVLSETKTITESHALSWPLVLERLITDKDEEVSHTWMNVLTNPAQHRIFASILKPVHIRTWFVLVDHYVVQAMGSFVPLPTVVQALYDLFIYPANVSRWLIESNWMNAIIYRTFLESKKSSSTLKNCIDWTILEERFAPRFRGGSVVAVSEEKKVATKEQVVLPDQQQEKAAVCEEKQVILPSATKEQEKPVVEKTLSEEEKRLLMEKEETALMKATIEQQEKQKIDMILEKASSSRVLNVKIRSSCSAFHNTVTLYEDRPCGVHTDAWRELSNIVEIDNKMFTYVSYSPNILPQSIVMDELQHCMLLDNTMLLEKNQVFVRGFTRENIKEHVCLAEFLTIVVMPLVQTVPVRVNMEELTRELSSCIFVEQQRIPIPRLGIKVWADTFKDGKTQRGRQISPSTRLRFVVARGYPNLSVEATHL